MASRLNGIIVLLVVIVLTAGKVSASGFAIFAQGARALALAGAFVAGASDPSAIFYNPAGISNLTGTRIQIGSAFLINRSFLDQNAIVFQPPSVSEMENAYIFSPSVFLTSRLTPRLTAGIGIYRPFGYSAEWNWNANNPTASRVAQETNLRTLSVNPVVSYQVSDVMSLAAGFRFVSGSFEFIRDDNTLINTDISGSGSGFNAGVQFSPVDNITLGFTYKSEVSLSLDGNTSEVPGSPGSGLRQPSPVNTELKLPQSIAVGINWITETQVVLEFDAIWFGWSSIDRLDLSPASSSYTNNIIDFQFEDKIQYRIGFEYNAANILTFRTGVLISSSPVKDSAVHPAFPDTDTEAASLGVGWTNSDGNLTIDFAYMHVFKNEKFGPVTNGPDIFFGGRYENNSDGVLLSVNYIIF